MCTFCSLVSLPVCSATTCGIPLHQTLINASIVLGPTVTGVFMASKSRTRKKKNKIISYK